MRDQEIIGLYEAYQQIYAPQEITEEVEIASQYFYEMGLNDVGVEVLANELGVDNLVEWVYEIADNYVLTEARAGGAKIEPRLSSGKAIEGKPKAASLKALRKKKAARQEAENKASEAKPSGMKAALQRQSAIASAKTQQPKKQESPETTKRGIGGFLQTLSDRAKRDTDLLKKSWKTARDVGKGHEKKVTHAAATVAGAVAGARKFGKKVEQSPEATRARRKATVATGRAAQAAGKTAIKAARAAGAATGAGVKAKREGKTGAQIAGRAAGTFVRKMQEDFEFWVDSLVQEGYDLSDYTWDEMADIYISEGYKRMNRGKIERQAQRLGGERGEVLRNLSQMVDRPDWRKHSTSQARKNRAGGAGSDYRKGKELQARDDAKSDIKKYGLYGDKKETNEQADLYDIILSHLLDEGYAETLESAEVIIENMSEEWVGSIVEKIQYIDEGLGSAIKKFFKGRKKPAADPQPESRGAQLRRKYNVGPERSDTSAKRQILNRSLARAERDERDYGGSRYTKSVAQKSKEAHERYLRAGYSKYGVSDARGKGSKARRKAERLQWEEYELYNYLIAHLIDEGYADNYDSAEVIMANMSEEWVETIIEAKMPYPEEKVARKRERVKRAEDVAIAQRKYGEADKLYKRGVALATKTKMGNIGMR